MKKKSRGIFLLMSVLTGCLNRPLSLPGFSAASQFPPPVPSNLGLPEEESPRTEEVARELSSIMEAERTSDVTGLVYKLLVQELGASRRATLTMQDIRFLQEQYLRLNEENPGVPRPVPQLPSSISMHEGEACEVPLFEVRSLPNGIQYMQDQPTRDHCLRHYSRKMANILNSVMTDKTVTVESSDTRTVISSVNDFMDWVASRHFSVDVTLEVRLAAFVRFFREGMDPWDPEAEIPAPLWLNAGFETASGASVTVPATHSEIVLTFSAPRLPVMKVRIFYGDQGFWFKASDAHSLRWPGHRILHRFGSETETLRKAVSLAGDLRVGFAMLYDTLSIPLRASGFGVLGVCNDGASLLAKGLNDDVPLPFPLVRNDLIPVPQRIPLRHLWIGAPSDTSVESLGRTPEERKRHSLSRILNSYPWEGMEPGPLMQYESLVEELKAGER